MDNYFKEEEINVAANEYANPESFSTQNLSFSQIKRINTDIDAFTAGVKWTREKLEPIIDAVYEGSSEWEREYKDAFELLSELVALKKLKDDAGKTEYYLKQRPLAWEKAQQFLSEFQHQ